MRERTIEEVNDLDEDEWGGPVECMSSNENMDRTCRRTAEKEILLTYEDEPNKTFHTCLCSRCAKDYCKKWDKAQIFGEQ